MSERHATFKVRVTQGVCPSCHCGRTRLFEVSTPGWSPGLLCRACLRVVEMLLRHFDDTTIVGGHPLDIEAAATAYVRVLE